MLELWSFDHAWPVDLMTSQPHDKLGTYDAGGKGHT
jgi:hypothetical protein